MKVTSWSRCLKKSSKLKTSFTEETPIKKQKLFLNLPSRNKKNQLNQLYETESSQKMKSECRRRIASHQEELSGPISLRAKYNYIPDLERYHHLSSEMIDHLLYTPVKSSTATFQGYYPSSNRAQTARALPESRTKRVVMSVSTEGDNYPSNVDKKVFLSTSEFSCDSSKKNLSQSTKIVKFKRKINEKVKNAKMDIIQKNKLMIANVNKSKRCSIMKIIDNSAFRKGLRTSLQSTGFSNVIKRSSLVDKFMIKLLNPDAIFEDYISNDDRPGDKYKRFKHQLVKEKRKIYTCLQDVKRAQMITDTMVKVYVTQIKKKKYT